tara:strand:+ start:1065 stop:1973 length:909 start_codon:yes stop_codon:yes gene_type:complete
VNRILVIGDHLLDCYRFYEQTRTDPANGNVPVIELLKEETVPGGTGNLVRNLEALCEDKVNFFHKPYWDFTPTKTRHYVDDKFILREDKSDSIIYHKRIIDEFLNFIYDDDFVIISDYHKGTITPSDIKTILDRCEQLNNVKTFVDTNHVFPEHKNITWLKINRKTAFEAVNTYEKDAAKIISNKTSSNTIITKGEAGFVAYIKEIEQTISYTKDDSNGFIDSIGAGDSFLAGFVAHLAQQHAWMGALFYADIVAHLSTQRLGTLSVVGKEEADAVYHNINTSIEEVGDTSYIHRSICPENP